MAYSSYTPSPASLSTLSVPDAAELQSTGIAAYDAPIEAIADAIAHGSRVVYTKTIPSAWASFAGTSYAAGSPSAYVDVLSCAIGDTITAHLSCTARNVGTPAASTFSRVRLFATDDYGGTPAKDEIEGALIRFGGLDLRSSKVMGSGVHAVASAGTTRVEVEALRASAGVTLFNLSDLSLVVSHLRGT